MIVHDMPEAEYHSHPAFSSTQARQMLESPARYKWGLDHPRPDTAAFDVGTAAHSKILGVGSGVIAYPDEHLTAGGNVSSKKETIAWADQQRAAGLTPVSPNQIDAVNAMSEAVLANRTARALLERPGHAEASVFATDPDTGIEMRARFDFLPDNNPLEQRVAVDLKTTAGTADKDGFSKAAASYRYDVQRGHYLHALEFAAPDEAAAEMKFIVVEKTAPYLVGVHQLDERFAEVGEAAALHARRRLAECLASDEWPGYPDNTQIVPAPMWLLYQHEERYGTPFEEIQ